MLKIWRKKGRKHESDVSTVSDTSSPYDWAYGTSEPIELFSPTAPPVYETKSSKFHVMSQLKIATKLSIGSAEILCQILEQIVQKYNGSFKFKSHHLLNLILVGTHMKKELDHDSFIYKGLWDDVILYEGLDVDTNNQGNKFEIYHKYKIKGFDMAIHFESDLRMTTRSGMTFYEVYNIPMSSGRNPPILNWMRTELGI
ncbi:matrix protein [Hapavirus wongabel]|uniref:Matrix protein n=1 Tax=Hapavirus wongabel TaxID=1972626 RepID=B2X7D7_9RHAB|nr:matrix protein [Hapavirus wongabel]ABV01362.1 matrix protein [Hapavirus wongabel]